MAGADFQYHNPIRDVLHWKYAGKNEFLFMLSDRRTKIVTQYFTHELRYQSGVLSDFLLLGLILMIIAVGALTIEHNFIFTGAIINTFLVYLLVRFTKHVIKTRKISSCVVNHQYRVIRNIEQLLQCIEQIMAYNAAFAKQRHAPRLPPIDERDEWKEAAWQ